MPRPRRPLPPPSHHPRRPAPRHHPGSDGRRLQDLPSVPPGARAQHRHHLRLRRHRLSQRHDHLRREVTRQQGRGRGRNGEDLLPVILRGNDRQFGGGSSADDHLRHHVGTLPRVRLHPRDCSIYRALRRPVGRRTRHARAMAGRPNGRRDAHAHRVRRHRRARGQRCACATRTGNGRTQRDGSW